MLFILFKVTACIYKKRKRERERERGGKKELLIIISKTLITNKRNRDL